MNKILKVININGRFEFVGKQYPKEFIDFFNMCLQENFEDCSIIQDLDILASTDGIPCICTIANDSPHRLRASSTMQTVEYHMGNGKDPYVIIPKFDIDEDIKIHGHAVDMQIMKFNRIETI